MATKKGRRATKENKAQGVAKKRRKPIHRASLAKKVAAKKAMPKKAALGKAASKKATPKKAVLAKASQKQAMAKKAVAKPAPAKRPEKKAPALAKAAKQPIRRRDGSGHLDPKYAATLRRLSGAPAPKEDNFVDGSRSKDDLAEILAEQFVERATTGEEEAEEMLDQEVPEERGGPFVPSTAGAEFAEGTDPSNPKGSKREPFPTT